VTKKELTGDDELDTYLRSKIRKHVLTPHSPTFLQFSSEGPVFFRIGGEDSSDHVLVSEADTTNYHSGLRATIRGLWLGVLDYYEAYDILEGIVRENITRTWEADAASRGITSDKFSPGEQLRLQQAITDALGRIDDLLCRVLSHGRKKVEIGTKSESHYRASLRPAIRGLWNGSLDYYEAYEDMMSSIRRYFREAFLASAKLCGIAEDELTPEERRALEQAILNEYDFIDGLLVAVQANSRAEGGKLKPLYRRLDKWVTRYKDLESQAMQMTCADRKLAWRMNPAEHCVSCLKLSNKVKRASYWREHDIRPQSPKLQCMIDAGGTTVCKCNFEITDETLSKGPLPRLP